MPATSTARTVSRRRLRIRLRELIANQVRLWDGALDGLEPWRQEGPLRWRGNRLEGTVPMEASPQSPR